MNKSDFELKISQTGKPVIVDFWAAWCVPCRITKPILEKLAAAYSADVEFLAVNADEAREVLERFHITSIPTVLALRDGNVVERVTGAHNETGYRAMFESLVNGTEVEFRLSAFDRMLRLIAGALLIAIGLSNESMLLSGIGGIVAFLGVYDRCPLWAAITTRLKKIKINSLL